MLENSFPASAQGLLQRSESIDCADHFYEPKASLASLNAKAISKLFVDYLLPHFALPKQYHGNKNLSNYCSLSHW